MQNGGAERQRSVKITFSLNEERRFVKEGDVMMIKDKNVSKPFPPSRSEGITPPPAPLLHLWSFFFFFCFCCAHVAVKHTTDRHLILFNDVLLMCFTPTMKSVRPARVRVRHAIAAHASPHTHHRTRTTAHARG
jgi:hypothetical protein